MAEPLTAEGFAARCDVSRETLDRLCCYRDLLLRWQKAINLVGPSTLDDVWRRHFWDSAQLLRLMPPGAETLLDIGSGAGFPGLVLAILGIPSVSLVESDSRKCAFLREVARQTGTTVTVHAARLETLNDRIAPPDVITARAVAPFDLLLEMTKLYMAPSTVCLFMKGRQADAEIEAARARRLLPLKGESGLTVEKIPSETDASGVILRVEGVGRNGRAGP